MDGAENEQETEVRGELADSGYPTECKVNREALDDLNNDVSDDEIIAKYLALPDLRLALWGNEDASVPQYVVLHHAASRGREKLLRFILENRPSEEFVNVANENFYTALRYAHRNNLPNIVEILLEHGAVEPLPSITIDCKCGNQFIFTSQEQDRYRANGYQAPKRCRECRELNKSRNHDREGDERGNDRWETRGGRGGGRGDYGGGRTGGYNRGDRGDSRGGRGEGRGGRGEGRGGRGDRGDGRGRDRGEGIAEGRIDRPRW
jgi:hypothetical protein